MVVIERLILGLTASLVLTCATGTVSANETTVTELVAAADSGDAQALYQLGIRAWRGTDGPADLVAAEMYLRRSIAAGRLSAAVNLARVVLDAGRLEEARRILVAAVDNAVAGADVWLARGDVEGWFGLASEREAGLAVLKSAAQRGDSAAMLALADAFSAPGATEEEAASAEEFYRRLAAKQDPTALYRLGILVWRAGTDDAGLVEAQSLLQASLDAGRSSAAVNLARVMIDRGMGTEAKAVLQQAVDAGVSGAELWYARGNIEGWYGTESDQAAGIATLRNLAETGDSAARLALAEALWSHGRVASDRDEARGIYEELATSGDPTAFFRLGMDAWQGENGTQDFSKAEAYLRQSLTAGREEAVINLSRVIAKQGRGGEARALLGAVEGSLQQTAAIWLARGDLRRDFGAASRPDDGKEVLLDLSDTGDTQATAALAGYAARTWRHGLDVEEVAERLHATVTSGDPSADVALPALLQLLRRRGRVFDDPVETRRALLDTHAGILSDEALLAERIHLMGDDLSGRAERQAIAEAVIGQPNPSYLRGLTAAYQVDPRNYTMILQSELKLRGYFDSKLDGWMTTRTIRAFRRFCRDEGLDDICTHGPMRFDAVKLMSEQFADPGSG